MACDEQTLQKYINGGKENFMPEHYFGYVIKVD